MSIKPAPIKFLSTFNIHNYVQEGSYLTNTGTQTIYGQLRDNGEIVYGDSTVYGDTTFKDEPVILNVTANDTLLSTNLTTKQYVDNKVESYVTSAIPSINPQTYTYSSCSTTSSPAPLGVTNNIVYVQFADDSLPIQNFMIEVNYQIIMSTANSYTLRTDLPISYSSTYEVSYIKSGSTYVCKFLLINGEPLTTARNSNNSFNQNYTPIQFGVTSGSTHRPVIIIGFPSDATLWNNDPSLHSYWISSYGCQLRILQSSNISGYYGGVTSTGASSGNVYFSTS